MSGRAIFRAPAFGPYVTEERMPGPGVVSDADWDAYLRQTTFLGYHPMGTCAMGPEIRTSAGSTMSESMSIRSAPRAFT